jgi:hypothetical protein
VVQQELDEISQLKLLVCAYVDRSGLYMLDMTISEQVAACCTLALPTSVLARRYVSVCHTFSTYFAGSSMVQVGVCKPSLRRHALYPSPILVKRLVGESGIGTGFFSECLRFPCHCQSVDASRSFVHLSPQCSLFVYS